MPHKDPEARRAYCRKRHRKDPSKQKRASAKYHASKWLDPTFRAQELIWGARARAKDYGVRCTLSVERVAAAIVAGTCARTGLPFDLRRPDKAGKANPFGPSLDRVAPGEDYSDDNVEVVCHHYNIMKNDLPEDVLLLFCRAVVARGPATFKLPWER